MRAVVEKVVKEALEDKEYDFAASKTQCEQIVRTIQTNVKALGYPSYKLIIQSVIGQVAGQGVRIASKCLWDEDNDNYATYTFSNQSLYCTTMVFGIYLE